MKSPLCTSTPATIGSNFASLQRKARLSPFLFTLLLFLLLFSFLYGEDLVQLFNQETQQQAAADRAAQAPLDRLTATVVGLHEKRSSISARVRLPRRRNKLPFAVGEGPEECDLFAGRWVHDDVTRPLYQEAECPYIPPQLTCQEHGRPDKDYQYWRWQPHGCSIPSFNATMMLEALRGKRMLYVGDSLNRGQFTSMVCLLQSAIPDESAKSFVVNGSFNTFTARDYNATVEFYWAPFLLESNSDDAIVHRMTDRTVRQGSINKHGQHWKGTDILVFSTYLWWMTGLKFKILVDQNATFQDEGSEVIMVSTEEAYGMGIRDMVQWVRENMDLNTSRVFFTSMSPTHQKSQDWGDEPGNNCYNETVMIQDPNYWGTDSRKSIMGVIREVLDDAPDVPVSFLNITQLSSYRKDAHTSIYKRQWTPPTPEQLADPKTYADCVHYCLPGLQDTWNELLFAKLFYP